MHRLVLLTWLPVLAACAPRIPPPLLGTFPELTVAQAQVQGVTGERVRWGGQIVSTTPQNNETCIEVVEVMEEIFVAPAPLTHAPASTCAACARKKVPCLAAAA